MLILHISDIHFRSPDCLNPDLDPDRPYRTMLIRDVQTQVAHLGPVGAVLIGGDIAFKGAPDEYATAMTWIGELAAVAGCPMERVFAIPGNHDVDRGLIARKPATQNVHAAISNAAEDRRERVLRTQISDPDTARALLDPISAYNDFAKLLNCQVYLPDRLYWKQDLDLDDGVVLRVHGLTSTLLSGAGGLDDAKNSLYLSPLQTVLDPIEDVVNLVFSHHPPDWLRDEDNVEDAVCGRAQIHVFGHKHRQRIRRDEAFVRFSAGAVNPDRNEAAWQPGYNFIEVGVEGHGEARRLVVNAHLRQWQTNPDMFRAIMTVENSEVFTHSLRFPGRERPPLDQARPVALGNGLHQEEIVELTRDETQGSERDGEAAMGDASTRNLIFRFWNLNTSARREIMLELGLITKADLTVPEPERYGRALIKASKLNQLDELGRQVSKRETANGGRG